MIIKLAPRCCIVYQARRVGARRRCASHLAKPAPVAVATILTPTALVFQLTGRVRANRLCFLCRRCTAVLQDRAGSQPAQPGAQQGGADLHGGGKLAPGVQVDPQRHGANALLAGVQVRGLDVSLAT